MTEQPAAGGMNLGELRAGLQLAADRCDRVLKMVPELEELIGGVRGAVTWADPEATVPSIQRIEEEAALASAAVVALRKHAYAAKWAALAVTAP